MKIHFQKAKFIIGFACLCLLLIDFNHGKTFAQETMQSRVDRLIRNITDPNFQISNKAIEAFGKLDPEGKRVAVNSLISALEKKNFFLNRGKYFSALGEIGQEASKATPHLINEYKNNLGLIDYKVSQALHEIGPNSIPYLISALDTAINNKNPNTHFIEHLINELGHFNLKAQSGVTTLVRILETNSKNRPADDIIKRTASEALKNILGPDSIPHLIRAIDNAINNGKPDTSLIKTLINNLGSFGPKAQSGVTTLINILKTDYQHWSGENDIKRTASEALKSIGPGAKDAVPVLLRLLGKSLSPETNSSYSQALCAIGRQEDIRKIIEILNESDSFRKLYAAETLGCFGEKAKDAVQDLILCLGSPDPPIQQAAAEALGNIGPSAKDAVDKLIEIIKKEDQKSYYPKYKYIKALGQIGLESKKAIPALTELLRNNNDKSEAASSLKKIIMEVGKAKAREERSNIKNTYAAMLADPFLKKSEEAKIMKIVLDSLPPGGKDYQIFFFQLTEKYPWITLLCLIYILWVFIWLILFWVRPETLLHIDKPLINSQNAPLPWLGGITVPLRYLLFVGFLNYRLRVLDSWVKANIATCRDNFANKSTVKNRLVHIDVPVRMDQALIELTAKNLQPIFEKQSGRLLIWGEGGSGKTSLACRIAGWSMSKDPNSRLCRHLMLPVLIEEELNDQKPLIDTIAGQLESYKIKPIQDEFLKHLLRRQRILVIVDRLSEMSEATHEQTNPENRGFPVKALIVTSRLEEDLGRATKTVIQPIRIEGNRLSSFMDAYLSQRKKRELFLDSEFFDGCKRLSTMAGDRDITVLLVKLFAEQMIAAKESEMDISLSENIPDLMLGYLNELNQSKPQKDMKDPLVHRVVKVLAWECLKQTFHPAPARYDDVLKILSGETDQACLNYLKDGLHLIETVLPAQERFRFSLDPLAEYLAGLHIVELFNQDPNAWQSFLKEADSKPGAPGTIRGFLLAVRDCCMAKAMELHIPNFVEKELSNRAYVLK